MQAKFIQVVANGDPGGGTTAVLTLATMLHATGATVIIVSQSGSYILSAANKAGLYTIGFDFSSRSAAIRTLSDIADLMRRERPAAIHAHGSRAGLPVALACRLIRAHRWTKFIYTVHGFHFVPKPLVTKFLGRLVEKFCIKTAAWTNFVSQGDKCIAAENGLLFAEQRTSVIPNAVLAHDIPPPTDQPFDIIFLGRLTYQKNPLILSDVIQAMAPLKPSVHVVGGGELEAALRAKVDDAGLRSQFTFHGQQDRAAALRIAVRCKVLVLPSRWEGHPITLIEAMHLGLPVVASRVSGSSEIVLEGKTGYLVGAEDIAGYANALAILLKDSSALQRFGMAARQEAAQRFSADRMLAANLAVYHGTVGISRGAATGIA